MIGLRCTVAVLSMMVVASQAGAAVIGGEITGGTVSDDGGLFRLLSTATGFSVGNNSFDSPDLYAFDEAQSVARPGALPLDFDSGVASGFLSSHYVFFDPFAPATVEGYVDFDGAIFGIATSNATLAASDSFASSGVTYADSLEMRGLESFQNDWAVVDPTKASRLLVSFRASAPGDYVRVFTVAANPAPVPAQGGVWMRAQQLQLPVGIAVAPIPLPAAALPFLTALAGLAFSVGRARALSARGAKPRPAVDFGPS